MMARSAILDAMTTDTYPIFGVDIGRVLIAGSGSADTSFFSGDETTMLATPEVPGAVDALRRLVELGEGRVWLISKCGPRVADRSLRWLDAHDVYGRSGLDRTQIRFCRTRPEKAVHARALGVTHMVDDKPDVHEALAGLVSHRYLFGPQRAAAPRGVVPTASWPEVLDHVVTTLPAA
jgi:hypothetical protein